MAKITIEELYRGEEYDIMSAVTAKALMLGIDERTEEGRTWIEMELVRQTVIAIEQMKKNGDCIAEGDLILVKKTETANDGDVVVALTEDGNTLKRLFWENGKPRLHAENKTYTGTMLNFYPRELTIQGIALKVIKDIR